MFERALESLTRAGVDYAVFGSAAGATYGWSRPPRDVDVFVRCDSIEALGPLFPRAQRLSANGLLDGEVEVWAAPLVLRSAERTHPLAFDAALSARRLEHHVFGWVLAPEDQLIIKLTLRRCESGKSDLDDAAALLHHWEGRLDRRYLSWRAARCGVTDLVDEVLS
jgi:hypothetical protein